MKSENHLVITGIVTSDVAIKPEQPYVRFRIIHSLGIGSKPLFLDCLQIIKPGTEPRIPKKGNSVRVRAYLRMKANGIEAVVKSMDIEP